MSGARRCVCFGSSKVVAGSEVETLAHACGAQLARLGWEVMSGGYEGAMGAVSRGAREAGGRVIGVTTPVFTARAANPALHEEWTEPDYLARMATLLRQGHAFVGLPGGLGTAAEWVTAWCLASIGRLPGPLLLFRDPWEPVVRQFAGIGEVPDPDDSIVWVGSATELADRLGPAAGGPSTGA